MTAKVIIITLAVILIASIPLAMTSCKGEKYKVICDDFSFTNVKSSYKAGDKVKIYFSLVATDTDYTFYLDGERIKPSDYSDYKGYLIEFIMPGRDVELSVESKNSMEYHPASIDIPEGTVLFSYTEKVFTPEGETLFSLTAETTDDPTLHRMTVSDETGSTVYSIPRFAYESIYNYDQVAALDSWNSLTEYESLDGKSIELSFYRDGEYITLSSDHMPEDGEGTLKYMLSHFTDYMTDDYLNK